MILSELKQHILNNTLILDRLIFQYEDNAFLVNSYIDAIAKQYKRIDVTSLREIGDIENDVFEDPSDNLYVLACDTFEQDITNTITNRIIVKTKKVTNENSLTHTVKFDKLLDWQVEEYVKVCLPGVKENAISWLCDIAQHDIYRLDLECKKISIFPKELQQNLFDLLSRENMYDDLNSLTIFHLTNAIMKHQLGGVKTILENIKNIDVEPTGLVTILYKNFKLLLAIQESSKATPESLGISPKQFNAIRMNCGIYKSEKLHKIFNLLTSIDYRLKSGLLANDNIIDYLIVNIL